MKKMTSRRNAPAATCQQAKKNPAWRGGVGLAPEEFLTKAALLDHRLERPHRNIVAQSMRAEIDQPDLPVNDRSPSLVAAAVVAMQLEPMSLHDLKKETVGANQAWQARSKLACEGSLPRPLRRLCKARLNESLARVRSGARRFSRRLQSSSLSFRASST